MSEATKQRVYQYIVIFMLIADVLGQVGHGLLSDMALKAIVGATFISLSTSIIPRLIAFWLSKIEGGKDVEANSPDDDITARP